PGRGGPRRAGAAWRTCPLLRGGAALGGAALEALYATAGVDELLAPGVERMAVRADLDVDLGLGRARRELVATRAADVGLDVLRVNFGLHGRVQCSGHPSALDCSTAAQMPISGRMASPPRWPSCAAAPGGSSTRVAS